MPYCMKKVSLYMTLAAGLLVSGCNSSDSGKATDQEIDSLDSGRVYLEKAKFEDVAENTSLCRGNSGKLCVRICHRPPGNPDNSKVMDLPLEASNAHLNHGGSHHERDYLGECREGDDYGQDIDVSDSDSDSDSDTGFTDDNDQNLDDTDSDAGHNFYEETDENSEVNDSPLFEVPNWCLQYYEIDQNCDGIVDDTGEYLIL